MPRSFTEESCRLETPERPKRAAGTERQGQRFCWRGGFTLVELMVVMAVLSILAALLLPALHSAIASARELYCKNNVRQTGIGFSMYSSDFSGFFPAVNTDELNQARSHTISWDDAVYSYLGGEEDRLGSASARYPGRKLETLHCPLDAARGTWRLSYTMTNGYNGVTGIDGNSYRCPRKSSNLRSRDNGRTVGSSIALLLTDQHLHRGQGQGGAVAAWQYWSADHASLHREEQALNGLYFDLHVKSLWKGLDLTATAPEVNWYVTGPKAW